MGMVQTIEVLNRMVADGVIKTYAISGAIAAFNYIEPASTDDLDILVSFETELRPSGLVMLTPILSYLSQQGFDQFDKEGVRIEGWPVQFLPVASPLDAEALTGATTVEIGKKTDAASVKTRILTAEHLMAKAIEIGRPKDLIRITQFLEGKAFEPATLCAILQRHQLQSKWSHFCERFEIADPCSDVTKP